MLSPKILRRATFVEANKLGNRVANNATKVGLLAVGAGLVGASAYGVEELEKKSGVNPIGVVVGGLTAALGLVGLSRITGLNKLASKTIGKGINNLTNNVANTITNPNNLRRTAVNTAKNVTGVGKGLGQMVQEVESHVIRPLVTGKGPYSRAATAYMPGFDHYHKFDVRRYALNPAIGRRAVAASAMVGLSGALVDATASPAPPASVVYDGTYMRHVNDRGVNAHYGQRILGKHSSNSTLNLAMTQASI